MIANRRSGLVSLVIIMLWVMLIIGGYFYYHKPITVQMVIQPLSAFLDLVIVLLWAGLMGGIGSALLKAEGLPGPQRALLQFGLGVTLVSLLWLAFGALGLYRFPLAVPLLLLGLVIFFRRVRAWYGEIGEIRDSWRASGGLEKVFGLTALILVSYQLLLALAPPTKWDALTYHLQLPRLYLDAGYLKFTPEIFYWGHPQLVEMQFTLGLALYRTQTAVLMGWAAGVVFLLALFSFTNHHAARLLGGEKVTTAGWLAVTALLAGQTFRHMLAWAYVDIFAALFGLAALIAFFEWYDQKQPGWFYWAGLFAGAAVSVKLTAGVLAVGLFGAALFFIRSRRLSLKTWLLGGLLAFVIVLPWLVKNLIVTGSPVYPYLFPTEWIDATRLHLGNRPPATIDWARSLLLPLTSTWMGIQGGLGFDADLGPLLLLFGVPALWLFRADLKTRLMGIFLVPALLALFLGSMQSEFLLQTRLYYVVLPCFAALAGLGWAGLQRMNLEGVRLRRLFAALILLVMGLVFWQDTHWMTLLRPDGVLFGTTTEQAYLENYLGDYTHAVEAVKALPEQRRVLMLWEPRGYYAPLNVQADLWIDRWITDRRELGSPQAILQRWHEEGFTHLLVYEKGIELIQPGPGEEPTEDWLAFQEMMALLPEPDQVGEMYRLYPLGSE